jgi:hypothetical protein
VHKNGKKWYLIEGTFRSSIGLVVRHLLMVVFELYHKDYEHLVSFNHTSLFEMPSVVSVGMVISLLNKQKNSDVMLMPLHLSHRDTEKLFIPK